MGEQKFGERGEQGGELGEDQEGVLGSHQGARSQATPIPEQNMINIIIYLEKQ